MKTKKFQVEREIANEALANVMGGTASSKLSITLSLTPAALSSEKQKKTDSDSDAEQPIESTNQLESK
ncbi:MAG TPA: hypothetical protein DDZ96_12490 [Porphyromonadaceae bacterium]|jgi:hypothetical protein|nr:hypothetical protein [Porphyromonadaceae bacterium]HBX20645.1 hypothetical protein [Porphyromonadaceae bacterium]